MQSDLQTPIQYIKGVGPRLAKVFARLGLDTIEDLFYHIPIRYIDRRTITTIAATPLGKDRVIIGKVTAVRQIPLGRRRIFEVVVSDGTGQVSGKWFNFHPRYMYDRFKKGQEVLFAGELTEYNDELSIVHPEAEVLDESAEPELGGRILPIYPLTDGLSERTVRRVMRRAWDGLAHLIEDPLPPQVIAKYALENHKGALEYLHFAPNDADVAILNEARSPAHRSIIFGEFFLFETVLALRRGKIAKEKGIPFKFKEDAEQAFEKVVPFELTFAQKRVVKEIRQDMERPHPMNRLLQGDVGSGKTVVAFAAALQAVANGYQVAFMAPTEILAEQHYHTIAKWAEELNIPLALLTSSVKGRQKGLIYQRIAEGRIPIAIGTHALIQSGLEFNKLGLAVIDEQHRFGVEQRAALRRKGISPDVLAMTATPIPRTLAMTFYGDLEISILDEMPKGRRPIITKLYTDAQRSKLYNGMRIELERGHQIYVVYPLIEESEKVDLKNATDMAMELKRVFEPRFKVELLHGRMKSEDKNKTMDAFKNGRVHILAATSVVEVGIDYPNATVMIIEEAERFGLAQLHQLRGRVGRGLHQSFCILVVNPRVGGEAKRRLKIMTETNDGFRIAEEDLAIRGPGEVLGTRQSGLPDFKIASIVRDVRILESARQAAFEAVTSDPEGSPKLREAITRRWGRRMEWGRA